MSPIFYDIPFSGLGLARKATVWFNSLLPQPMWSGRPKWPETFLSFEWIFAGAAYILRWSLSILFSLLWTRPCQRVVLAHNCPLETFWTLTFWAQRLCLHYLLRPTGPISQHWSDGSGTWEVPMQPHYLYFVDFSSSFVGVEHYNAETVSLNNFVDIIDGSLFYSQFFFDWVSVMYSISWLYGLACTICRVNGATRTIFGERDRP